MEETKESRDAPMISKPPQSPNAHSKTIPMHKNFHPRPPHSPTFPNARMRSLSMGSYGGPLLVPQSHPPCRLSNNPRSLSLSPTLRLRPSVGPNGNGSPPPGVPFLGRGNEPPRINESQRAMEAASMAERKRAKELEAEEVNLSADELRAILKKERHRMAKFAADVAKLKIAAVQCQAEAEVLEEGRINGLMRRLEVIQIEKGRIINELEREEEMLTNTLQKKLNEVRREKAELEKLIEREQLAHSDLHSKLTDIRDATTDGAKPSLDGPSLPPVSSNANPSEETNNTTKRLNQPLNSLGSLTEDGDEDEEVYEMDDDEPALSQP